ncbi:MAG: DUF4384 domain-containing protein [Bryobacteraceae bacterium]
MSRALLAAAMVLSAPLTAADRKGVEVVLERSAQPNAWKPVDPRTVLDNGDHIRFRFATATPGWLYVYVTGSSGSSAWLLPGEAKEIGYRVEAGAEYRIPAAPESLTVSGPEGYDVVYWILSPRPLAAEAVFPGPSKAPRTLRPMCRERLSPSDPCLDDRAGPSLASAAPDAKQPRPSGLRARELTIDRENAITRIEPVDRILGLIVYEFRIAHRGARPGQGPKE